VAVVVFALDGAVQRVFGVNPEPFIGVEPQRPVGLDLIEQNVEGGAKRPGPLYFGHARAERFRNRNGAVFRSRIENNDLVHRFARRFEATLETYLFVTNHYGQGNGGHESLGKHGTTTSSSPLD